MAFTNTLSQELEDLINPEPSFEDPEDYNNIDTSDQWYHKYTNNNIAVEIPTSSKIINKQVSFLSSLNKR